MDLNTSSTEFNWHNALSCANASKLAYQNGNVISDFLSQSWGYDETIFFDENSTQGFIARKGSEVLLSFRGTKGTSDWIANLDFLKTRTDYGKVHTGFLKAYEAVRDTILAEIFSVPNHKIFITGHSLGGALACIAAADIAELGHGDKINGIYTFGQPRTGNSAFKKFIKTNFQDQMFRFVYDDDIVPRIPPFFKHCGDLYKFDKHGTLTHPENHEDGGFIGIEADEVDDEDVEDAPLTQAEFEALQTEIRSMEVSLGYDGTAEADEDLDATIEGIIPSVSDHSMVNYVNAVRRIANASEPTRLHDAVAAQPEALFRSAVLRDRVIAEEDTFEVVEEFADEESEMGVEDSVFADGSEAEEFFEEIDISVEADEDFDIPTSPGRGRRPTARPPRRQMASSAPPPVPMPAPPPVEEAEMPELVEMAALVRLVASDWTPPDGITVNSKIGMIASIKGSLSAIESLDSDRLVVSVEYSRDAGIEDLGTSVPFINADKVHRPDLSETGDKAIVGIIDSGIDILHEAFLNAAGQTRVLGVWYQKDKDGSGPHGVDSFFSQTYGAVYTHADIQDLITRSKTEGDDIVPSVLRDKGSGHGTHVASIAAGKAVGELSAGLAPDAGILVVIPHMRTDKDNPLSLGYSSSHVDALHFLKMASLGQNAFSQNRCPIAINVSLGMNAGAHDGTSLLEAGFDSITGIGRDPGISIVKSAGNERGRKGHASMSPAVGMQTFEWESKDRDRIKDYFEVWYNSFDDLEFILVDPDGNRSDTISTSKPTINTVLGGNKCVLALKSSHEDNGDSRLTILIYDHEDPIQVGAWQLEVIGKTINSQSEKIDIWVERDNSRAIEFEFSDHTRTLSIPGTAKHVICVGATTTTEPPGLYKRSSFGPTRLKGKKPEISAPGDRIIGAKAGGSDHQAVTAKSGTSMAAPHISGLIALAFSKRAKEADKDQLNSNQIKVALMKNVRELNGHTPGFGFGLIDALKFMKNLP